MWKILYAVYALSTFHALIGLASILEGAWSIWIAPEVWMAHRVSPFWSGAFFLLTATLGFLCARKRTVYLILCFSAFSVVSMVVAVISIQLLRLGLVNHMSDGDTLKKEEYETVVILSLSTAGLEILVCMTTALLSCKVARLAKKETNKQNEGTFSVTILSAKDIVINTTKASPSYDKLSEVQTSSALTTPETGDGGSTPAAADIIEKDEEDEADASQAMIPTKVTDPSNAGMCITV